MDHFRIRPISETDIDDLIASIGGCRAHPDADSRDKPGADYLLGEALIEYKGLDDEGLAKPERQAKLAELFRPFSPRRPVIVLDKAALPEDAQRSYDKILQGPIKGAVDKAKKQLKQSRAEHPLAESTVLLVINNGYTALDHDELLKLVAHRARQDTEEIDGVVVGGVYFYSDGFDNYMFWPFEYVPIRVDRPFKSFALLRKAWWALSERFATEMVLAETKPTSGKEPVVDIQFEVDGVTYVKTTPPMGEKSDFFQQGRPRKPTGGFQSCPPVGRTFPAMTSEEWRLFRAALPNDPSLGEEYRDWRSTQAEAAESGTPQKPFVAMPVTCERWSEWCRTASIERDATSVRRYANELFERKVRALIHSARELTLTSLLPSRFVLVVTELIGQDTANDVSHIAVMKEIPHGEPLIRELVTNARLCHEHALALGCAHAVANGIEFVLWKKDQRYAWL